MRSPRPLKWAGAFFLNHGKDYCILRRYQLKLGRKHKQRQSIAGGNPLCSDDE